MEFLDDSIVPEHARDLKQEAREFAEAHIEPITADYYESGEYPREVLQAGMDAGLVTQSISEEYGGKGLDLQQMLAISEEFYCVDAGIALTLQLASFGCEIMEHYGSEEQKEKWLRPVAGNEQPSGLAVSELQTGSDVAGMETAAEKTDDGYVLNGEKYWVGNAVEADWLTVYARTADTDDRYSNYSIFIAPTDMSGYEAERIPEKMGMRIFKQGHIVFDDCEVPKENLIGTEGGGFYMLADFFNRGRVIIDGYSLGLAAATIEETWEFIHDRQAFGRSVSEFQVVQYILTDMHTEFKAARALNWRVAEKVTNSEDAGFWAAATKTKSTETAVDVTERGMQFHGGRSVLNEYKISRIYCDTRIPVIYEGANEIQRNLIYR